MSPNSEENSALDPQVQQFLQAVAAETAALKEMEPNERSEYVSKVILGIGEAILAIKNKASRAEQAIMAKKLFQELNDSAHELLPAFMFTIKDEFHPTYITLLEALAGQSK